MFRTYLLLAIIGFSAHTLLAQDVFFNAADTAKRSRFPRYGFIELHLQPGKLIGSGTEGLRYIERNPVYNADLRYGLMGYGRKKWHALHRFPAFGVGIGIYRFRPSHNILGNPWSTYVFYREPLSARQHSTLAYDISVGLSYGWKPYDSLANPEQKAIGSPVNVMVSLALRYQLNLSNRVAIAIGPAISHFSNGRTRTPNRGLNLYGMQAAIRYNLPAHRKGWPRFAENIPYSAQAFEPRWEMYAVGGLGIVTTFNDINTNRHRFYWTTAVSADAARQYSYTGRYGMGIDWFTDGSIRQDVRGDAPFDKLQWWGVHISHEYLVHRWSIVTQPGLYFHTSGDKGSWFGRVALRYDLTQRLFLRGGVRIYKTFRSDSIEGSIGYTFWRKPG
jgi:hypothetical protein